MSGISDNTLLVGLGVGVLAYGIYKSQASNDNKLSRAGRQSQIWYSDAARIPPGSLLKGVRRVHPNRVDFLGMNGVVYVGYFAGGQIPSSTMAKQGFP
jgi:hypothetical protein